MLQVEAIKTEVFSEEHDLLHFLETSLQGKSLEGHILAVTSKIVSLFEHRCVSKSEVDKEELIRKEADHYLGKVAYDCHLTIKFGQLIPSAGIDESNSIDDSYILYPLDPFLSAHKIQRTLKDRYNLENFGVILTDSRTQPLRKGVTGTALSYCGFEGIKDQVGDKDLFGRELKMTKINLADALATSAVLMMGEGADCCPLALIKASVEFNNFADPKAIFMDLKEDLYWPIIKVLSHQI